MSVRDSLNLLSKLNATKIRNGLSTLGSYYRSKNGNFQNPGLPISLAFEPTTSCNLRCPECPSGLRSFTRPTGMLDVEFFKEKVDEMKNHLLYLTFYFQGEPYLHNGFLDMVDYAVDRKIYSATSTNAHYLDNEKAEATVKSGLDRLIISIDGTTQDTYEQYRVGGELEKVLQGTRNLVKWKRKLAAKTPHLIFQFLVVKPNEHQINEAKSLAKEIGVDEIQFKTAQIYDYENGSPLIPENQKYSRYKKVEIAGPDPATHSRTSNMRLRNGSGDSQEKYILKNPLHDHCWKMWHSCVVTWDGKVVPCCFDKDAKYPMGDLNSQSMKDIWYGEKYEQFRRSILQSRSSIDICRNCSEGMDLSLVD